MKKELIKVEQKNKKEKKAKKIFTKIVEILKKKWLVNGTKTIVLVAIIIAIYIGVNIVLEKVVLPEIDCTPSKKYSISNETRDKIKNIDKQITITLINYSENTTLVNFIDRYIELNNNIKVEKTDDLSARTDLMTKYSLEATDSLMIVESEGREKTINNNDLYTYDYSTYEQIDTTEEAITNAIIDVTTEEKPKIYFLSTHLMYSTEYYSTIIKEMEEEANEVETLDILSRGEVPSDCDCLIMTTLKEDLTEKERDKIIEYIKNGGEILLMCGPNISNIKLTNFQKILDQYGLTIDQGVVFEGSGENMLAGYPDFIIEKVQGASITQNLNMTMNICLPDAGKIIFDTDKEEELGLEQEILVTTTDKAFIRTDITLNSASRTNSDGKEEQCTIGMRVSKKIDDEKVSKIIIFSNELFAMDMPIQLSGYTMYTVTLYNNRDIILNSISYLNEREDTITIRKADETVKYTVTAEQNRIILTIIFGLPLLIIILGIIKWILRRRKK